MQKLVLKWNKRKCKHVLKRNKMKRIHVLERKKMKWKHVLNRKKRKRKHVLKGNQTKRKHVLKQDKTKRTFVLTRNKTKQKHVLKRNKTKRKQALKRKNNYRQVKTKTTLFFNNSKFEMRMKSLTTVDLCPKDQQQDLQVIPKRHCTGNVLEAQQPKLLKKTTLRYTYKCLFVFVSQSSREVLINISRWCLTYWWALWKSKFW